MFFETIKSCPYDKATNVHQLKRDGFGIAQGKDGEHSRGMLKFSEESECNSFTKYELLGQLTSTLKALEEQKWWISKIIFSSDRLVDSANEHLGRYFRKGWEAVSCDGVITEMGSVWNSTDKIQRIEGS